MTLKKLLSLALALVMLCALTACGEKDKESSSSSESQISAPEATPEATPEPTPEPTAEPTATPAKVDGSKKPSFGPLSDDIYSYQIEIAGEVYQFPMTFEQFIAYGWEYKDDVEVMLDSMYYSVSERFTLNGMECYASIINLDINSHPIKDCLVGGISISNDLTRKAENPAAATAVLPGKIEYNVSTAQQARDLFGTPSYESLLDSGTEILEYKGDRDCYVKMTFDSESKLLRDITIRNFIVPEGFEFGEVSDEVPDIVARYEAPTAVSDDFADWTVDYGGKLYRLPAPVSEFTDGGWTIDEENSEMTINGRGHGWIVLKKDNQKLKIIVSNYSEGATTANNCFVTTIKSDPYDTKIPLIISKGITIGTSEADLKAAISGLEVEEDESSSYRSYRVKPTGSIVEHYDILVSTETNNIYKIEIDYAPKYSVYTAE